MSSTLNTSAATNAAVIQRPSMARRIIAALLNAAIGMLMIALAWGRPLEFFRDPLRVAAAVLILVPTVTAMLATSFRGRGLLYVDEGRVFRITLMATLLVGMLVVVALDGRGIARLPGGEALRIVGMALLVIGTWVRIGPMVELGHRFSAHVALQEEHRLQTTGWYSMVRHPSYLGLLLILIGYALVFRSLLGLLLLLPAFVLLRRRMNNEERFLGDQFGEGYRTYMAHTKRLVPGLY